MKNREIKFRAWVPYMNKMFHWGSSLIRIHHDLSWDSLTEGCFNAETSVLMQYTGLNDSKGVEIYEGDLFPAVAGNIYRVAWNNEAAKFSVVIERTNGKMIGIPKIAMQDLCKKEICGNIYENPELLEQ